MYMETPNQYSFPVMAVSVSAAAAVSFGLCLAAEFKKSKKNDLRLDGKLCYLPGTAAFELGIAALICLSITQIIASLFICGKFCSNACQVRKPTVSCSLLLFSWISFGIAVILITAATSMSRSQALGEGWLEGECYLVKDGVYVASAILALLALSSTLGYGVMAVRRKKTEEENTRNFCKS